MRALVGSRVSVLQGPQKVSHLAQLDTTTKWAESKGYTVVGSFEDLGVSASVSPGERPDLGLWLTDEGAEKWDAIVWAKMDRAFRSTKHCVEFAQWAEDRGKVVVFAEDGLTLDYRPGAAKGIDAMMAELFVYLGSFFAQMELNRFKTRAEDGHRYLRTTDRWASGVPPLGFRTVPHPSGKGKGLETDPEGYALLHQMAGKLLDGWSFIRIAEWLNETGAQTNQDRSRPVPRMRPWSTTTVIDSLTSPKTQGFKMHRGKPVLDSTGEQLRLAPPTFDPDTWIEIQDAARTRQLNRTRGTQTQNPMLGVGVCGVCGASLAQQFSKKKSDHSVVYRYYRCGRTPLNCNGVFLRADDADQLLEQTFLELKGDDPVTRRVFVPGEADSHELDQVNAIIERLRREADLGLIVTEEDEQVYVQRMQALITRREALAAVPARSSGWVTEETGETYTQAWQSEDHRQLLVGAGIRFVLYQGNPINFELQIPGET